jgi:hypothetical protein
MLLLYRERGSEGGDRPGARRNPEEGERGSSASYLLTRLIDERDRASRQSGRGGRWGPGGPAGGGGVLVPRLVVIGQAWVMELSSSVVVDDMRAQPCAASGVGNRVLQLSAAY